MYMYYVDNTLTLGIEMGQVSVMSSSFLQAVDLPTSRVSTYFFPATIYSTLFIIHVYTCMYNVHDEIYKGTVIS